MLIILVPKRLSKGIMVINSSLSPEFESAMTTSSLVIMPRSPWLASAGCIKKAGVPVLAKVEAILLPICPDFPIPLTTTLPWQCKMSSTALVKLLSSFSARASTAFASINNTDLAISIGDFLELDFSNDDFSIHAKYKRECIMNKGRNCI